MYQAKNLTSICRIGLNKESGDEWSNYTRAFELSELPKFATIKLTSEGVCGIFVNGEFVEAHMGRLPNRIAYVEITSKLHVGKNEIKLVLGSHIFQDSANSIHERRGSWFSFVAAEIEIELVSRKTFIRTDGSWKCSSDLGQCSPSVFSEITIAEYERFWEHAALYHEVPDEMEVPKEIVEVAGAEYSSYLKEVAPKYATPKIIEEKETQVLYDFGRLEVGYAILDYEAQCDTDLVLQFDYTESLDDFTDKCEFPYQIMRLEITVPIQKGRHTVQLIRRRACRYMLVKTKDASRIKIHEGKMLLSMNPDPMKGWFRCNEELLNKIWEVGKYTLQVNKHQEYESCPRHEMLFFSGDGIIDALIDYYTSGYTELVDASLAPTETYDRVGIRHDVYNRCGELWDYPAWRLIMQYNHYVYYADKAFVEHYYPEMVTNLLWMIDKMGSDNLIYQYPMQSDVFFVASGILDYGCSYDRIGYKTYLNSLLYKSLLSMSELGEVMNDSKCVEWKKLAEDVRTAINEKLWSDDMQGYVDLQYPENIPQDGNSLAVLFGIADEEKAKLVLKTLEKHNWSPYGSSFLSQEIMHTRDGCHTISPTMTTYEVEARFLTGDYESALELIRRCWGTMLAKGAGTFWEFAPNNGTDRWPIPSHAWSAGCTYLLSAYVLGIRPATPGYEKMLFKPCMEFASFEGVVPTKHGYVAVNCSTKENKKIFTLAIPKAIEVEVIAPEECEVQIKRF